MEGEDVNEKQHNHTKKQRICTPQTDECTTGALFAVNDKSLFDAAQARELALSNINSHYIYLDDCGETVRGVTSLLAACQRGLTEMKTLLLDGDAKIEDGQTPLLVAYQHGHTEIMKVLLERDPNIGAAYREIQTPFLYSFERL